MCACVCDDGGDAPRYLSLLGLPQGQELNLPVVESQEPLAARNPQLLQGFGGQARLAAPPHTPFNLFALTFLNLVFQILNVGLGGVFPMFAIAIPWSHNKQPKGVKRWWMIKKLDTFLSL